MTVERCSSCRKLIDALAGFLVVVETVPTTTPKMELEPKSFCSRACVLAGYPVPA